MKVYIKETIDYTLKRKGDRIYTIVDGKLETVKMSGAWKTKAACMRRISELGYTYWGMFTEHQNYSHWAGFEPER